MSAPRGDRGTEKGTGTEREKQTNGLTDSQVQTAERRRRSYWEPGERERERGGGERVKEGGRGRKGERE